MADARAKRLRKLAWPPTCAYYVSHLHDALRHLIEKAERFAKGSILPGYDQELGERDLWNEVYGVQNLLRISRDIPTDDDPSFQGRWDAERWLNRIFSDVRMDDPRYPPPPSQDHARRLSNLEHIQAYREILSLVPDPFDCPNGHALALFEWARHHLGTDPDDWDFEAKVDNHFLKRWKDAIIDTDENGFCSEAVSREIRRRLLIEAGLLRSPSADLSLVVTKNAVVRPTVEQVEALVESIKGFVFDDEQTKYYAWCLQDVHRLPGFLRVVDALRSFREPGWKTEGWPTWIAEWLPDVAGAAVQTFDDIAGCWGWEELLKPRSHQEGYIKDCDRLFRERHLVPIQTACKESAKLFDPVSRPTWIEQCCVTIPPMDFDSLSFDFKDDPRLDLIRKAVWSKRKGPLYGKAFARLSFEEGVPANQQPGVALGKRLEAIYYKLKTALPAPALTLAPRRASGDEAEFSDEKMLALLRRLPAGPPVPAIRDARYPRDSLPDSGNKSEPDNPLKLDDLAVALLTRWITEARPKMSKRGLARALDCHPSSLRDCPTFNRLWEANKSRLAQGYRDGRTGDLETPYDDD